jgi:hypothetical protein
MLGLWVFMRNAAPVIGGAIIFGLNAKLDSSGGVSLRTYLVIIGIMCAGPFIALLISSPGKVQRKDGVKIVLRKMDWSRTLYEFYKVISSRDVSVFIHIRLYLSAPTQPPLPRFSCCALYFLLPGSTDLISVCISPALKPIPYLIDKYRYPANTIFQHSH